ncbi:MAG: hypothetical protein JW714_02855 [Candidatus Omnitrophica bacterium]|nr:hypothetical protein [Candidatus Omnitrophota bacterium]
MHTKIAVFFTITAVFCFAALAAAQEEIRRDGIICATLDAIEHRHQPPLEVVPSTKTASFFSDFAVTSPLLDTFSLWRTLSSPILCFDEEELIDIDIDQIELSDQDLGETISLSDEIGLDEPLLLDSLGEEFFKLYLGLQYGYMGGRTNYEIDPATGKTEKEYSLKNYSVVGAKVTAAFPRMKLILDNAGYISLYDRGGKMHDTNYNTTGELSSDTYSEAYLKLLIWDSSLGYVLWQNFSPDHDYEQYNMTVSVLGGYRHEYFKYKLYDVYDTSTEATISTGPMSKYRVTYNIPYLGLKISIAKPEANWGLSLRPCYSPFVRARDVDDDFTSERFFGEATGWAAMMAANLFWNINNHWTLQGGIDYANVRTRGEQTQTWYSGASAGTQTSGIQDRISSNQLYYWARINYNF